MVLVKLSKFTYLVFNVYSRTIMMTPHNVWCYYFVLYVINFQLYNCHWYICGGYMSCPTSCKTIQSWPCNLCHCPEGTLTLDDSYKLQPCQHRTDCARANQQCEKDYCLCNPGYVMIPQSLECMKLPTMYNEICHYRGKWVRCDGTHLQTECDKAPGLTFGRCICKMGYTFDKVRKMCVPLKLNLGDPCKSNADCSRAFSYCKHRFCSCRSGFMPAGDICQPFEKLRPYIIKTETILPPMFGAPCNMTFDTSQFNFVTAGCEDDGTDFCYKYPQVEIDYRPPKRPGHYLGHCCPNPSALSTFAPVCPESRKTYGSCKFSDTGQLVKKCTNATLCIWVKNELNGVCCRQPCNLDNYVNFDGQCYALNLELDSPCDNSEQCPVFAECVHEAKVCKSKHGYIALSAEKCDCNTKW